MNGISPITGWTRSDWERLADRLLQAGMAHGSAGHGRITYPGTPGGLSHQIDGLEGFARTGLLAGARLVGEHGSDPLGLAEWWAAGIVSGADPDSRGQHREDRWERPSEHPQAVVESCTIALLLHFTRPWIWDRLSSRAQEQVIDYLSQVRDSQIPANNWVWFQIIVETFLRGVGAPWSAEVVERNLASHESWYRGGGWLSDGAGRNYDHYVGWAMETLPALWTLMAPQWDRARDFAAVHGPRLRWYLEDAQYLVGDGGPLIQGRSLIYRWCTLAPFWAGELMGVSPLDPGLTRRICSGTVRHFLDHGAAADDILTMGWFGQFRPMAQYYSGTGSPYWASKGMLGLALDSRAPVWTAVERPTPVELADTHRVIRAPGWLVSGTRCDGIVRIANLGTDGAGQGQLNGEAPLYSSLAYSTVTAPPMAGAWKGVPAANAVCLRDAEGRPSARSGQQVLRLEAVGRVLVGVSRWRAHWMHTERPDNGDAGEDFWYGWQGPSATGPWITCATVLYAGLEVRCIRVDPDTDDDLEPVALEASGWPVEAAPSAHCVPTVLTPVTAWPQSGARTGAGVTPLSERTSAGWLRTSRIAGIHVLLVGVGEAAAAAQPPKVDVAEDRVRVVFAGQRPVTIEL